jgi:hypothetical protein
LTQDRYFSVKVRGQAICRRGGFETRPYSLPRDVNHLKSKALPSGVTLREGRYQGAKPVSTFNFEFRGCSFRPSCPTGQVIGSYGRAAHAVR